MQCGAEILACSMLIKCSLKAFEIPTGLLICSPFTSIKKNCLVLAWLEQLAFKQVAPKKLWKILKSIFHSFFGLFVFSMISFLIYAALAFAIFFTTWLRKFLYNDLARIFDFARDLNWSLRCIRCMIFLFIQGDRHLRFTLFLTMGM